MKQQAQPCGDYDAFAWFYNRYWGPSSTGFLGMLKAHVLGKLPRRARVLDLCCGTGHLAAELVKLGYEVTGFDRSSEMLSYARKNTPDATFVCGDARSFEFAIPFAAVICTSDSLNHLLTGHDLHAAFESVWRSLETGGIFAFDMNTEAKYTTTWRGTHAIVEDAHVGVFRSSYDSEQRIASMDITLFEQSDSWKRTDVRLLQTWFPIDVVKYQLTMVGFHSLSVHPLGSQSIDTAEKVFWVASRG